MTRRRSSGLPERSEWLYRFFSKYSLGYVQKHIKTVRMARGGVMPGLPEGPLLVVLNHPSWWDPMIGLVLASKMPGRHHYAAIDVKGLSRYPFLERLGFFGIEPGTTSGARSFLKQASAILNDSEAVIWLTAQGEFVDPRQRPIRIKGGIGHLLHRCERERLTVWTLALEYPFWEERTPEALVRFGPAITVERGSAANPAEWTARIERELENAADQLAEDAIRRDPSRFQIILEGRGGVGGIYDVWRRFKALLLGRKFIADHGSR